MSEYFSTSQVAEILGLTPKAVRDWIGKGELPAVRVGKLYKIPKAGVELFLKKSNLKKGAR